MKVSRRLALAVVLLPIAGAAGLVALKETLLAQSLVQRVPIVGYDPRDLLHGHYLLFRFDLEKVPAPAFPLEAGEQRYFIPEAEAPLLDRLLRERNVTLSVEVHKPPAGALAFGKLYIEDLPWRDWLALHPEELRPE